MRFERGLAGQRARSKSVVMARALRKLILAIILSKVLHHRFTSVNAWLGHTSMHRPQPTHFSGE